MKETPSAPRTSWPIRRRHRERTEKRPRTEYPPIRRSTVVGSFGGRQFCPAVWLISYSSTFLPKQKSCQLALIAAHLLLSYHRQHEKSTGVFPGGSFWMIHSSVFGARSDAPFSFGVSGRAARDRGLGFFVLPFLDVPARVARAAVPPSWGYAPYALTYYGMCRKIH